MTIYTGKTVLVTGSRGIGEAIIKNMFAKGANVIIVSPSESSDGLAASITSSATTSTNANKHTIPNKVISIRSDLSSSSTAKELATKAIAASHSFGTNGKIDILILCGAICPFIGLDTVDEEAWDRVFAVNVVGPVFLIQALASSIVNDGRIILFSSSGTISNLILPVYLPYMSSKGAIEQAARVLSKEPLLVSRGIATTVISPGVVATEMLLKQKTDEELELAKSFNPYKRLGETEDIVVAVDAAIAGGKWLNGANLRVNGGSVV